jgi:AmmeMemoRadiSam system protein A
MDELGAALLRLARHAIADRFGEPAIAVPEQPALQAPGATFVTLTQDGRLRGCIGTLEAWRPLALDVQENARGAAFRDPRFPPLPAAELPLTRVEVSLLTPPEPLPCTSRADALARLRPGIDGVIFSAGRHRATFLPQVWDELREPDAFLGHLIHKAGLPADYWNNDVRLERYQVQKWKEAMP